MGDGLKRARKPAHATHAPLITDESDYEVDGGRVLDEMSGVSRVDLVGEEIGGGCRRAVALSVTRSELRLYPIGAKVRVTVARVR